MKNVSSDQINSTNKIKPSQELQKNAHQILNPPMSTINTALDSQNIKDLFGHYKIYDQDFETKKQDQSKKHLISRIASNTRPHTSEKENRMSSNKSLMKSKMEQSYHRDNKNVQMLESRESIADLKFDSEKTQKHDFQRVARNNYMRDTVDNFYGEYQKQFLQRPVGLGQNVELKRRLEDLENIIFHWQLNHSKK
jgi:hypothetical protein